MRWFDLYDAIRAGGHRLWLSIADVGWGSVIGNTLDHGVTYLPYGQDMAAQCGMEVVLANGDVLRTGMGALPGSKAWHVYKRGLGPTPDQLFMQSNYGIVTKMGVWLMPQPQAYMPFWVRVWNDDDLAPLVDTLRTLLLDRTIEGVPSVYNTLCLGSVLSSRSQWYDGEGPIPDLVIDRIARELEIGRWIIRSALWGDDAVVEHRFAKIKRAFEQIPGAEVWGARHDPETAGTLEHPADLIQAGVPNLRWNTMTAWYGGEEGGHIGFSPIAPLRGEDAIGLRDLLRGLIEERAGLDYIAADLAVSARSFAHVTHDPVRHEERAAGTTGVRHRAAARDGGREAGLRRVPRPPRLHGSRGGPVLVQRPRVPALHRDDQGRVGSEWNPLAGQAGDLAELHARASLAGARPTRGCACLSPPPDTHEEA